MENMGFSKLTWYSPENGNAWPKCLRNHFGGGFARFLNSVLRFGRSKCHFLALESGHFWQKCPFSSAKKWHFERPDLKTESKNLAKHPPKWLGRHLVHAFPFLGKYQFWRENSKSFCNGLVMWYYILCQPAPKIFWLLCILEHPSGQPSLHLPRERALFLRDQPFLNACILGARIHDTGPADLMCLRDGCGQGVPWASQKRRRKRRSLTAVL